METESGKAQILAKHGAIVNPLRFAIAKQLVLRKASAAEVSAEIGAPVGQVRYQLKRLVEAGLVDQVELRPRRGAMERVYTVRTDQILIDAEELSRLSEEQKLALNEATLKQVAAEVIRALRSRVFLERSEYVFSSAPFEVDEQGWLEAARVHEEARERVEEVAAASAARLAEGGEDPILVDSVLLYFQREPPAARPR